MPSRASSVKGINAGLAPGQHTRGRYSCIVGLVSYDYRGV